MADKSKPKRQGIFYLAAASSDACRYVRTAHCKLTITDQLLEVEGQVLELRSSLNSSLKAWQVGREFLIFGRRATLSFLLKLGHSMSDQRQHTCKGLDNFW